MDSIHYNILTFLKQNGKVPESKFPNEITSHFDKHSIRPGSLVHELEIVLGGRMEWVDYEGAPNRNYFITEMGVAALNNANKIVLDEQINSGIENQKKQLEIQHLINQVDDFKPSVRRGNIGLWIAILGIIASLLIAYIFR